AAPSFSRAEREGRAKAFSRQSVALKKSISAEWGARREQGEMIIFSKNFLPNNVLFYIESLSAGHFERKKSY
ncbi:hypothetical protein, partial [uncultured Bilophila sp.]